MRFINRLGNTINLADVSTSVPFLGDSEQELDTDTVKRSFAFQSLVISRQFEVTGVADDRLERNLFKLQQRQVPSFDPAEPVEVAIRGQFGGNTGYAKANRN